MIVRHINNNYFSFTFEYDHNKIIDSYGIVTDLLREQTDLFYIVEQTGFSSNPEIIARILDENTATWLKLLS